MQSFRTEIENPVVEKDIIELERKIRQFRAGDLNEEKFRSLRLARGVYGQRQPGVQMIRIKLPFGKLTGRQLLRIAAISDKYSNGNLHLTTRQDIQIHHVSLDRTPELWAELEQDGITLREACGNTVRNVTASPTAGIDPQEPFDVTPYADAIFRYFLRNPVCQELGRKFKIALSSGDHDTAYTFMNDLGLIPKTKTIEGKQIKGFKVLIGGGLGAQALLAHTAFEFLEENALIPFIEATLRVFDRHGERNKRHKARLKYLIQRTGLDSFLQLVKEETTALDQNAFKLSLKIVDNRSPEDNVYTTLRVSDHTSYQKWRDTNVFEQKQSGFYGVYIKVQLGNITSQTARELVDVIKIYAADDIRVTANQNLLLRFVPKAALPALYRALTALQLSEPGFDSTADITACPGTDTCNLGISNTTATTKELERLIKSEYADLIYDKNIKIKISGCMNACGQHSIANIGFHGSSLKNGASVLPALQILLGGGPRGDGNGRIADKVIKIPAKKVPGALRSLLNDFEENSGETESFNDYYDRRGKNYFYQLLKPLTDLALLQATDYIDWGHEQPYQPAIGVGECAGVVIDLVGTLFQEVEEKLQCADEALQEEKYADSIYHTYSAFINAAKALLLGKEVTCNTQVGIINDFDTHFVETGIVALQSDFSSLVLQINQKEPNRFFAVEYLDAAKTFVRNVQQLRQAEVIN